MNKSNWTLIKKSRIWYDIEDSLAIANPCKTENCLYFYHTVVYKLLVLKGEMGA